MATGEIRFPVETRGLVTAMVEMGLSDLPGLVPVVTTSRVAPGLSRAMIAPDQLWTASLAISGEKEDISVELQLCDPKQRCETWEASGTRETAHVPVARLLTQAADALDRRPTTAIAERWARPVSEDTYAMLLTGRAAATFYGLREGAPPERIGHKTADPIERAAFVDPRAAPAAWLLARRDGALGEIQDARYVLPRARAARPESIALWAEEAALFMQDDKPQLAREAWEVVLERAGADPRFLLPRAQTTLQSGRAAAALKMLDDLPEWAQERADVLEMRVRIGDDPDMPDPDEKLLTRWQLAAPDLPEPVRRRIALMVDEGRYRDALNLTEELAIRGVPVEASRLTMALGIGAGEWDIAAAAAKRLDQEDLARRILARKTLEAEPTASAAVEGMNDPAASLVRGTAALRARWPEDALAEADAVLVKQPWSPEALALRVEALEQLGRTEEAEATRNRLMWADPAWGIASAD